MAVLTCCFLFYYLEVRQPTQIRNVLIICIDTCRADYLSCYGYERKTTPNIDAIAKESILFENAVSPIPQTLPAHCSIFSGTIPPVHGVRDNSGYRFDDSNIALAEILKEAGFRTGAIVSSFVLDSQFGLDQGFDSYNDELTGEAKSANLYNERKGMDTTEFALRWLEDNKDENFFFFLHYYDPHDKYTPPEPYRTTFADNLYAGEIAYTDYCIGHVIWKLKKLKLYDSTLIIITADHGEMLHEHGEATHGYFIYESAIRVPLLFKVPGLRKSVRIKQTVGLVDIAPTVCSLLGLEPGVDIDGKNLSDHLYGTETPENTRYLYCESLLPTKYRANPLLGITTANWKYINTTRPELYDLKNDPEEQNNLISKEPKRAHLLRENLKITLEQAESRKSGGENNLNADLQTKARLESLGYVAGISVIEQTGITTNLADPKDLIHLHNIKAFNDMAISLTEQGRLTEAAESYEQIIEFNEQAKEKNNLGIIHANLAAILKKLGRTEKANMHFLKAAEELKQEIPDHLNSPDLSGLYAQIGNCFANAGAFKKAANFFEMAFKLEPANLNYCNSLAKSLEYDGQYDNAIKILNAQIQRLKNKNQTESVNILLRYIQNLKQKRDKLNTAPAD